MKQNLRLFMLTLLCAVVSSAWGEEKTATLTNANIVAAGNANSGYSTWEITDGNNKKWNAYAIKNKHSNDTQDYHFLQIKKYASNTAYYIQIPQYGTKITSIKMTVSSTQKPMDEGGNSATLYFSNSNTTSATGTGVASATGASSVTINCSTLNLNTGYITASGAVRIWDVEVTYEEGSSIPAVDTPTFSPADGTTFTESLEISIGCSTTGATIYYTTDGSTPTTSSSVYSNSFTITETTTVNAIAVKDGMTNSDVATATYTKIAPPNGHDIDFESEVSTYVKWTFTNIISKYSNSGVSAHGGSYYGSTDGKASGSITTNDKIAAPNTLTCYVSKQTTNTSESNWYIQVSENGTTWTNVSSISASSMTKGEWKELSADLSNYSDVYVRVFYSGSTAIRLIDDLTLTTEDVTVAKPTFSLAEGTYAGDQSVTITCETEGATIYYTTDGNTPDNNSTEYTDAITITETTPLKAIAYVGNDHSRVASVTYTIIPLLTISEVRAQKTGDVYTQGTVTSVSSDKLTVYIQDATAAICVYFSSASTLKKGDNINVQGTLATYKGLLEIQNPVVVSVNSHNNTVEPVVKTIAQINSDYAGDNTLQGMLVKIADATVTDIKVSNNIQSTTISQDENTIVVRGNLDETVAVNDIITLTGNIGCYDVAQIVHPIDVTVAVNTEPSITVTPDVINFDFDGNSNNNKLTVTPSNFEPDSYNVQFYAADGETPATYNWVSFNTESMTCSVEANTGAARSAYLKVSAKDANEEDIYSNLITINQAKYVIDYAEIPFEFNGGVNDIKNTTGLKQDGLGSDYNATNAPTTRLKFDGTGDWMTLKLDEHSEDLSLAFDIKGNSFSGGTYTVQTSADGETYTNLATYTELSDTQTEVFNLSKDIRYIKWIYTEKVSGNVGLGNIVVIASEEIVVTFNKRAEGYSTLFYGTKNLVIPEGVKASTYKVGDDGKYVETEYESIIPKGSAVVIELEDKSLIANGNKDVTFTTTAATETAHTDNMLYGFDEDDQWTVGPDETKEYLFYSLSLNAARDEGSIGFYWNNKDGNDNGGQFKIPAHRAYLAVEKETANGVSAFAFDGIGTGINGIFANGLPTDGVFTLTGVRVNSDSLQKGIYIVNGKKVVIK